MLSCSDYVGTSSLILCEDNVSKTGMPFDDPMQMARVYGNILLTCHREKDGSVFDVLCRMSGVAVEY